MKENNNNNTIPIGIEIKILRELLNLTQDDMAKITLVSRITLSKLEKTVNIEEISDNLLLRLYYSTKKIIENINMPKYAVEKSLEINKKIEEILDIHSNIKDL